MPRRTKEESARTRNAILGAAREVFQQHGVARTTMEQIAEAAGVTRGAVYFHFPNKTAVFYAVRDQVTLPLADRLHVELLAESPADPLTRVESYLRGLTEALASCVEVRATFEILSFKCEYVDEFRRELDAACTMHDEVLGALHRVYDEAAQAGGLRAGLTPRIAAVQTLVFVVGIIRLWLLDGGGNLVRNRLAELLHAHVESQRADPGGPPRRTAGGRAPGRAGGTRPARG